jgi:hypothetical protein
MLKNILILVLLACIACLALWRHQPESTSVHRMEAFFDRAAGEQRAKTREIVATLHDNPKHGFEKTKPYYEKALLIQSVGDMLTARIARLKATGDESVLKNADILKGLKDSIYYLMSVALHNSADTAGAMKALTSSCPDIMNGNWQIAQPSDLAMLRAEVANAVAIIVQQIFEQANSGCVLRFDDHYALAIAHSQALRPGDKFEGSVVFAARPAGYEVSRVKVGAREYPIANGIGAFTTTVTKPGINTWRGVLEARDEQGNTRNFDFVFECFVLDSLHLAR